MSNSFNTTTLIARTVAEYVHQNAVAVGTVNKEYTTDFTSRGVKPGTSITIETQPFAGLNSGKVLTVTDLNPSSVTLTVAQWNDGFKLSSIERALSIGPEGIKRAIEIYASRLVRKMEDTVLGLYTDIPMSVGTMGTSPASYKTFADGYAKLGDHLCPLDDNIYCAVSHSTNAAMTDALKGLTTPADTIGNQYITGKLVKMGGLKMYGTAAVARHTNGTATNTTPVVNTTSTSGATLTLTGGTTLGTYTDGTIVTVGSCYDIDPENKKTLPYLKQFVITAAATASGGAVNLTVSPSLVSSTTASNQNASAAWTAAQAITILNGTASQAANQSLIYHRDAIAFVNIPLEHNFGGMKVVDSSTVTVDGISIRATVFYDGINDDAYCRLDSCFGAAVIQPHWACRVQAE